MPASQMVAESGEISTETASFGMSWFWFPEAQFGKFTCYEWMNTYYWFDLYVIGCASGVIRTRVGFSGGTKPNPTYRSLYVKEIFFRFNEKYY